jgi:hypothetical protein
MLALLPFDERFGYLPPRFTVTDAKTDEAISIIFPNSPITNKPILLMLAASLVYHYDFLDKELHQHHRLRSTRLFTSSELRTQLRARITCGPQELDGPAASGVPIYVQQMTLTERVVRGLDTLKETITRQASNDSAHAHTHHTHTLSLSRSLSLPLFLFVHCAL